MQHWCCAGNQREMSTFFSLPDTWGLETSLYLKCTYMSLMRNATYKPTDCERVSKSNLNRFSATIASLYNNLINQIY